MGGRSSAGSVTLRRRALRLPGAQSVLGDRTGGFRDRSSLEFGGRTALVFTLLFAFVSGVPASAAVSGLHAPSPPGKLMILSTSKTSIRLSWAAPRSDVRRVGYRVYVNHALRASVRSTAYLVGKLACGKSYALAVSTFDAGGNSSARRSRTARTSRCANPSGVGGTKFNCYG